MFLLSQLERINKKGTNENNLKRKVVNDFLYQHKGATNATYKLERLGLRNSIALRTSSLPPLSQRFVVDALS